ncbi:MAG TPA: hypothetical protein VGF84_09610 [Micromonosporaceae bacterium]
MLRKVGILVAGTVLLTATMTGCKSSTTASGGAPAGQSQPKAAAGGGGGGTGVSDGLGHPVKICDLLPAATVAQITKEPITVAKEQDTVSYKIYACDYTSADGTSGLTVSVLAMDAAAGYNAALQANGSGAKPISGLGDKAFTAITGLQALYGNVSITVSNLQSDADAEQIIKTLQPKL